MIWIPKLEDIAIISNMIGICEDRKYGWPKNSVLGAEMVANYLSQAILSCFNIEEIKALSKKYKIPTRCKLCHKDELFCSD